MPSLDLAQIWTPLPTQAKFINAVNTAQSQTVQAYIGAFGSGKSWALCRAAIGLCYAFPGISMLLGRFNATDLRITTQATFFQLISDIEAHVALQFPGVDPDSLPSVGTYKKSHNEFEFTNKSKIMFGTLEDAERKYKSLNIGAFAVDEASEITEGAMMLLLSRCRNVGFPNVGFIASNPTGLNHWMYDWFARHPKAGYNLFRTNTYENAENLPTNYISSLRERYPEEWVRRYLMGEWGGIDEGQPVFPTFDVNVHVKPLEYDKKRRMLIGIDFGFHTPAVVWAQIDKDHRLGVLRCWMPKSLDTFKLCEGIIERNDRWFPNCVPAYFVGHDVNQKADKGPRTDNEILRTYGMQARYKYHFIERAFTTIRNMLKLRDDNLPTLYIDPQNVTLIEGFAGAYKYRKTDNEKVEKTGIYDPVMDALRYIVVNSYAVSGEAPRMEKLSAFGAPSKAHTRFPRVVLG